MYRRANKKTSCELESRASVDLNPMLDVIFILLVFFVVTASFIKESGVPEYSKQGVSLEQSESRVLTIRITHDGRFITAGRVIQKSAIRALAERALAQDRHSTVFVIKAEAQSVVSSYVDVVDALRRANVKNILLRVEQENA